LLAKRVAALPANADLLWSERTPLISGLASGVNLKLAAKAGVLGVICVWRGCAEDDVRNQYLPFTTPYYNCPALWVGSATGDLIAEACRRGDRANLVLEAKLDDQEETQTICAVLPRTVAEETIIVNTHSDGPNLIEENGIIGVLALANYFTSVPQALRRRTIVFVAPDISSWRSLVTADRQPKRGLMITVSCGMGRLATGVQSQVSHWNTSAPWSGKRTVVVLLMAPLDN
jgi:hypothetical protein